MRGVRLRPCWRRVLRVVTVALLALLVLAVSGWAVLAGEVVVPGSDPPPGVYRETFLGRQLGAMLLAMARGLTVMIEWLQTTSIQELVFDPPADWVYGTFTPQEWGHVLHWHGIVRTISLSAMVLWLGAMIVAFKVLATSFAPERRAGLGLMASKLLLVLIVAMAGPLLLGVFLQLNQALVSAIRSALVSQGILEGLDQVGRVSALENIRTGSTIVDGLVALMYVGVTVVFNLLYFIRKMMLGLTVIVLPLVAWAFVSTRTAMAAMTVLSELWSNALMPFTHALALAVFLSLVRLDDPRWWIPILGLYLVILMANFLRRLMTGLLEWFGVGEERWAGAAAAGLGGLVALGSLIPALAGGYAREFGAVAPRRAAGAAAGGGGGGGGATAAAASVGMPPVLGGGGPAPAGSAGGMGPIRPGPGGGASPSPSSGGFVDTPLVPGWQMHGNLLVPAGTASGGPGGPPAGGTGSVSGPGGPARPAPSDPGGPARGTREGDPRRGREESRQRVWRDAGGQTGWDRYRAAAQTGAGLLGATVGMGFDAAGMPGLGAAPMRQFFADSAGGVSETAEGFYWWVHNRRNPVGPVDTEGRAAPARPA